LAQVNTLLRKRLVKLSVKGSIKPTSHEKIDPHTSSKLAPFIRASGREVSEMALVSKLGPTEPNTQANGVKTELMAKESSSTLTVMCMMDFGQTIRQMVQVFTST
jgi:hypothetical protein